MDHATMRELRKQYQDAMEKVRKLRRKYEREKAIIRQERTAIALTDEEMARELEARGYIGLADDLRRRISGEG